MCHVWLPVFGEATRSMETLKRYEVIIYNQIVRSMVDSHTSHKHLKDDWADNHYQEVRARDKEHARRKMEAKFPAEKGFVIVDVIEILEAE